MMNVIQDHKARFIPYPNSQCMVICLMHDIYTHIMSIFGMYLLFSQVDFLIIRALADLLVTFISTRWFLQGKIYNVRGYEAEKQGGVNLDQQESEMTPLNSDEKV